MLENFTRSGLCEVEALIEFCDKFADDPTSVDIHALELGGCVLLSATIPLGKYHVTSMWFRNPMFRSVKDRKFIYSMFL